MFNFGPFRIGFGAIQGLQGAPQHFNLVQQPPQQQAPGTAALPPTGNAFGIGGQAPAATFTPNNVSGQLQQVEQQLMREINSLRLQNDQLYLVRALQGELARLRITQVQGNNPVTNTDLAQLQHRPLALPMTISNSVPSMQAFSLNTQQQGMDSSHQRLPPGVAIPEGWTMLPLQRISNPPIPGPGPGPWNPASTAILMPQLHSTEPAGLSTQRLAASSGSSQTVNQSSIHRMEPTSSSMNSGISALSNNRTDTVVPSMLASSEQSDREGANLKKTNRIEEASAESQTGIAQDSAQVAQVPTISPPIPAWGTTSEAAASKDENSDRLTGRNDAVPLRSPLEQAEGTGKGKAKAATVQDDTEDVD